MKTIIENAKMETGYNIVVENNKTPEKILFAKNLIYFTYDFLKMPIMEKICDKFGHQWRDESYGGPESGCVDLTCKRCGKEIYNQLY